MKKRQKEVSPSLDRFLDLDRFSYDFQIDSPAYLIYFGYEMAFFPKDDLVFYRFGAGTIRIDSSSRDTEQPEFRWRIYPYE